MNLFGIKWKHLDRKKIPYQNKPHARSISRDMEEKIQNFLEDPRNCVFDPNKKYVLKRSGKPRSVLNKSMRRNFQEFVNQGNKIGYSSFCKRRPKNTVPRKLNKWIQCLCEKCQNMENRITAIKDKVPFHNLAGLMKNILCPKIGNFFAKRCFEMQCEDCGKALTQLLDSLQAQLPDNILWKQWENVTETVGKKIVTRKWCVTKECNKDIFIKEFKLSFNKVINHVMLMQLSST